MAPDLDRRDFLAAAPAGLFFAGTLMNQPPGGGSAARAAARIETFDYQGVRLRPSRWKDQADAARDFYAPGGSATRRAG